MVFVVAWFQLRAGDPADPLVVSDVSGLNPARAAGVVRASSVEELVDALARARREGLRVSIGGRRHSQGGHIIRDGALYLDMTSFDRVLEVDPVARTARVEAGATWADVQEAVHPHGLAVAVMQSSNIFTVGGSLGVNAHGRDPRFGPIAGTVISCRVLLPSGETAQLRPGQVDDRLGLVLGGFGLFGVILEAKLQLVPDEQYSRVVESMALAEYPAWFGREVAGREDVGLHSARLSIAPGEGLLRDLYTRTYTRVEGPPDEFLREESGMARDRFLLDLSRRFGWGKRLRWFLQRRFSDREGELRFISRNNAMRPPIEFLERPPGDDTDILQEYFVPPPRLVEFVERLRAIVVEERINLLHVAIRYVGAGGGVRLDYAPEERFAVVLYTNIPLDEAGIAGARHWTRRIVDVAIDLGGSHYLAYQRFPTREQFRLAYPASDDFFRAKRQLDPGGLFSSQFYEQYGGHGDD